MSEFTDLVIQALDGNAVLAVLILGLGGIDVLQTKYIGSRFDRQGRRIGRLEDAHIQTDGGEPTNERPNPSDS
ncbi:hypothetical protein [Halorussus halophilus]|uniref:hypothetical protein n=1 Tax=Halorussus halophilus TaxID=2650975 RepID=UPI0013016D05|nr:hypothetical protein [Halorussus halophilus]